MELNVIYTFFQVMGKWEKKDQGVGILNNYKSTIDLMHAKDHGCDMVI